MILNPHLHNIDFKPLHCELNSEYKTSQKAIYLRTIDALILKKGDIVLEIGHNGADFLPHLLALENSIFYIGTEENKKLNLEAKYKNQSFYAKGKADFISAHQAHLPLEMESVDKVFAVNNLSQWDNVEDTLKEIHRILKPAGSFVISFDNDTPIKSGVPHLEDLIGNMGFSLMIKQKIKEPTLSPQPRNISVIHFVKN